MNVLVTGGAGFIGSHIVDELISRGDSVIIVDNFSSGKEDNLNKEATFFNLDITSSKLENIFQDHTIDFVIHLAAQVSVPLSISDPLNDAMINIIGGINILECCRKFGVKKIIFNSSGGAIAGDSTILPIKEEHDPTPISPYGVSKLSFEYYLEMYQKLHKLNFVSLRYSNVYGPRQNFSGECGVVAIFAKNLLDKKSPLIFGDGNQTRDFIFVKDVVNANLLALNNNSFGIYNICSSEETTINNLVSTMQIASGIFIKPEYKDKRNGDILRSVLSSEKAKFGLNWQPSTSLYDGVKETINFLMNSKK